jgi:hypothetical protein
MKLKLNKIVEVLIKMKDDDFYFKNYAPQIIESYTEEFAIGFVEWVIKKEYHIDIWIKNNSTKELLEIYKKEKGLCTQMTNYGGQISERKTDHI